MHCNFPVIEFQVFDRSEFRPPASAHRVADTGVMPFDQGRQYSSL